MSENKVTKEDQLKNRANFLGDDGNLFLVRCMACKMENYAMAVASGVCSWCGWPSEDDEDHNGDVTEMIEE